MIDQKTLGKKWRFLKTVGKRKNMAGCAVKRCGAKKMCEVGVRWGTNFGHFLTARPIPKVAVAVDIWKDQEEMYRKFLADYADPYPCVRCYRMLSSEASRKFRDGYFDYIYVDADHSLAGITEDIRLWYPKVKVGGVFAGHDYRAEYEEGKTEYGVKTAIDAFVKKNNLKYFRTVPGRHDSFLILKDRNDVYLPVLKNYTKRTFTWKLEGDN